MPAEPIGARGVADLIARYEAWQAAPARAVEEGAARLLALVDAVRALCMRGDSIDAKAVESLRDGTSLDFRIEGDAVLFELADDKNPGKTQTIAVRPAGAGIE
jgi:hypothetical protein